MLRRVISILFFPVATLLFWLTWPGPYASFSLSGHDGSTQSCQENLRRISFAFAQYAQDFDGKFPRGIDPEDPLPETWQSGYSGEYADDAQQAPLLREVLFPYLKTYDVWRCPADVGWKERRPQFDSRLGIVQPSSFAKFGTSYYYYTIHGFAGLRPDDFRDPSRDLVLFDGDFWHRTEIGGSLNAMFADGHVESLSPEQFDRLGAEQGQNMPAGAR